jgi:hypothetical protein
MKKIVANILFIMLLASGGYAQEKYSVGVDAFAINSLTKNSSKETLFNNDFGLQLGLRKNIDHYNFLNIHVGGTNSFRNKYNLRFLRIGYETGNLNNIKGWFVLTEIAFNNFRHIETKKNNYIIAPSLGVGYNLVISKSIQLRARDYIEYQIPNKVGGFFNKLSIGVLYSFKK